MSTKVDSLVLKNNNLKNSKDIETTINYNARDSILMDMKKRKAYLYGDAHVDYGDIILDAEYIEIDWVKSEVFARGAPNTIGGDTVGLPFFKEGSDQFVAKEMKYNFKTKKGIIKQVVTQEGDGYIHGETIKINQDNELFIGDAVYTTCNLEHPHFAIRSKKIKVIPDKLAVTGPFNLEIAGVKTPLGGPFGLFPLPKEKTSGIIMPTYGQNYGGNGKGFFLQNGGYYFAISDKIDAELKGDIYTNGSWRADLSSAYKVRYKFYGSAQVAISKLKQGFDVDTAKIPKGYLIKWKHSPEGGRNGKLTSSVDIRSANYNRDNLFSVDQSMQNNYSSSIAYYKQLGKSPFSINVSLRQSQKDSTQDYSLPDIALNMRRLQPFQKLGLKSSAWYKKIGIGYTLTAKNITTNNQPIIQENGLTNGKEFVELDFFNADTYLKNSKNGIKHTLPLTLPTFKVLKHFTIAPVAKYNEYWYAKRLTYELVDSVNQFAAIDENGFNRAYDYNTNVSLNTRLFGYLNVGRFGFQRIKQTMTPTISYTYKPDFGDQEYLGKFFETRYDTNNTEYHLNRYNGFVFGGPTNQEQQTVSFKIANLIEGKYKSRKDTSDKAKYFNLLDNLSASTSYNFAADSLNWTPLSITARTTVKGVSANFKSTHDLYGFSTDTLLKNYRVNEFALKNGRPAPRLTYFNLSLSTNLNPKKRQQKEKKNGDSELEELELQRIYNNIDDYVDFEIPWSLKVAYNIDWKKTFVREDLNIRQSIQFIGDISLTPKWKFTFNNVGYDIVEKEMLPAQIGIIRDLHCWEMRFSYIPFGFSKGFTFDINVKATALQSLKLSKRDRSIDR